MSAIGLSVPANAAGREPDDAKAARPGETSEQGPPSIGHPDHLLDLAFKDRGAARDRWKKHGYQVQAVYTADYFANVHGGVERGEVFLGNLDLLFIVDAERAFGWTGTTFLAYFLGDHGGDPSDLVGDAQILDNIAAPGTFKLFELLGEVRLTPQFSLLAGLYDLNSEFDVIDSSRDFINSSFGIGPDFSQSGLNGPSIFPTTSFCLRARVQPTLNFYLQAAVLDGVPGDPNDASGTQIIIAAGDGALFVVEGGWLIDPAANHPPEARRLRARRIGRQQDWRQKGKVALGWWEYSRRQSVIDSDPNAPRSARSWGAYLLAENRVLGEPGDDEQGLDLFARIGVAESRVNRFGTAFSFGATYTGPFPGRDEDEIGVAVASAINGIQFEAAAFAAGEPVDRAETAIELTYVARVRPWLHVQPNLQYIINPNTDPGIDDALAIGLRVSITF